MVLLGISGRARTRETRAHGRVLWAEVLFDVSKWAIFKSKDYSPDNVLNAGLASIANLGGVLNPQKHSEDVLSAVPGIYPIVKADGRDAQVLNERKVR